ncbi:hypothetical protein [Foetidibacter luteolus]|uniref:hypothetical protein n=1 Tax=Foetidibacter luteolus TaxID=2608880 RepID=UPI00129A5524|nr:hypothetical protein [Foetidibacter luteolus]
MTVLNIVPECFVDTRLAEIVSQSAKKYNHQHGHGNVASKMQLTLAESPALGIIDEDTTKVRKANYFSDFIQLKDEYSLKLKKHLLRAHYLIVICPAIEKWLLQAASGVNVDPVAFNLPHELAGFAQISKVDDISKNINFYRFVKELIRKESPGILTLKN